MNKSLSIDGGGAWGIGVAYALRQYQRDTGTKIHQVFKAFAGASTGSIIVTLLCVGVDIEEIYNLYEKHLDDIFKKYKFPKNLNPYNAKYDNTNFKKILEKYLGDLKFKDLKKPLFIPVTDSMGIKGKEKVYDLGDSNVLLRDAVLQSCSAPTYFNPIDNRFMDGGLCANNPSAILQAGLVNSNLHNNHKILSFNTGGVKPPKKLSKMNIIKWVKYLTGTWITDTGGIMNYIASKNLGEGNILRLAPNLTSETNYEMDDLSKTKQMIKVWNREYLNKYYHIDFFMKN